MVSRNQIWNIIYERCVCKSETSTISRIKAIYLGCKYHLDYVPILILLSCNLLNFGHTNDCYFSKISYSMDLTNYEWLYAVFFLYELCTDGLTYCVYRLLKRFKVLLRDERN